MKTVKNGNGHSVKVAGKSRAAKTVNGKASYRNGVVTLEGEPARMLREASEATGANPSYLFAACVKRFVADMRAKEKGPLTEQETVAALWELSGPVSAERREELMARLLPLEKSRDEAHFAVSMKVELHLDDWIALGKLARVCGYAGEPLEQWDGAIREAATSRFTAKELAMMAEGEMIDGVWGIQAMIEGRIKANAKAVVK